MLTLGLPLTAQIGTHISLRSESSIRKHAELYFERQAYSHAAKLYHRVVAEHPDDQQAKLILGDCYRLMREPHSAAYWYGQALDNQETAVEHLYHYASVLCTTRAYGQARIWYQKYLVHRPDDQRALAALNSLRNPQRLIDNRYQVKQLAVELPGAVFSPALYQNGLVVVGEGGTGSLIKNITSWNEGPYFDLYYIPISEGKAGHPRYLDDNLNSVFHEGPAVFFDNGDQVILTRSAFKKGQEDTRNLQLMIAQRKPSGNWSTPKKLFSHQDYSIGHPAVDNHGSVIYFSTDKPGGYGGTDIYMSEYKNGAWTTPVNLGPEINTAGNELFPSVDLEGTLYYATNGRGGLGGLEIFKVDPGSGKSLNLGFPINSSADDFGIVWHPEQDGGYFSTNRTGRDRIFKFQMSPQLAKAAVPVN
ncbi:MAG: hypothetical protein DHS20C17_10580 [Cyclobacteriaceae bacterium]|nr:MAG: hypothetical protein DHS20C17_10580 [Cyclobacteriaceae bacterium]